MGDYPRDADELVEKEKNLFWIVQSSLLVSSHASIRGMSFTFKVSFSKLGIIVHSFSSSLVAEPRDIG